MNKRILLIGGNYTPELTGIGKYNGEMIQWFAQHGLDVTVLTTYPYYPQWSIHPLYKKKSHWFSKEVKNHGSNVETIVRCPHYVPANPTGLKRLLSDITIFVSIFFALINIFFKKKYDYVLCVAPPFSIGILGIMYRLIKRSKTIYHIQDLQVDAARDLKMIKSKFVINTMFKIEKFILRQSDVISTISPGMINKI
ncbi:MAG: colanic acid biosynthesis glycosyltransferase WcaI, partial [Aquabacterium sp.]|nr:colanic acid biosynthesis glycosyltransferase WcaI [Ferruginibacter sp.]